MSRNIRKVIICVSSGKPHRPKRKWCWGLSCIHIITAFCGEFTYHVLHNQWTRHTKPKMKKWTRHMWRVDWLTLRAWSLVLVMPAMFCLCEWSISPLSNKWGREPSLSIPLKLCLFMQLVLDWGVHRRVKTHPSIGHEQVTAVQGSFVRQLLEEEHWAPSLSTSVVLLLLVSVDYRYSQHSQQQ